MIYAHDDFQRVAVVTTDNTTPECGEIYKNGDKYEIWDGAEYKLIGSSIHGYVNETGQSEYTPDFLEDDFFRYAIDRTTTITAPLNAKAGQSGTFVIPQNFKQNITWSKEYTFLDETPTFDTASVTILVYKVLTPDEIAIHTFGIIHGFRVIWDNMAQDQTTDFEGGDMEYSNDDGATWTTYTAGNYNLPVGVAGPGSWIFREKNIGTVTKFNLGFNRDTIDGNIKVFGGVGLTTGENMFRELNLALSIDLSQATFKFSDGYGMFSDCETITTIDTTGMRITNAEEMFMQCYALTSVDLSGASGVTNAEEMFSNDNNLLSINTSVMTKVTNATDMFSGCTILGDVDISGFSNITEARSMFSGCNALELKSIATLTHLTNTEDMFHDCSSLVTMGMPTIPLPVSEQMFKDCSKLECISNMDTTGKTSSDDIFSGCTVLVSPNPTDQTALSTIGGTTWTNVLGCPPVFSMKWDTMTGDNSVSSVGTGYGNLNYTNDGGATWTPVALGTGKPLPIGTGPYELRESSFGVILEAKLTGANVLNGTMVVSGGQLTRIWSMFGRNTMTSIDVSELNTSETWMIAYLFEFSNNITTVDVSNLNTSKTTSMRSMFQSVPLLTSIVGLDTLDVSNVTDMANIFSHCGEMVTLFPDFNDTSKLETASGMFTGCKKLTDVDLNSLNTSNVTNFQSMFRDCMAMSTLDLTPLDTSSALDISYMFEGCAALSSIDTATFNTSNVTNMEFMFAETALPSTGGSVLGIDTTNVTNMKGLFKDCTALTTVDIIGADMGSCTNISFMFGGCTILPSIDLSLWNVTSVTDISGMFRFCETIPNISFSCFTDFNIVINFSYLFDGCIVLTCIDKIDTTAVTHSLYKDYMFNNTPALVQPDATAQSDLTDGDGAAWVHPTTCP